jgi:predicted RecA/RadA family phage recombinase
VMGRALAVVGRALAVVGRALAVVGRALAVVGRALAVALALTEAVSRTPIARRASFALPTINCANWGEPANEPAQAVQQTFAVTKSVKPAIT